MIHSFNFCFAEFLMILTLLNIGFKIQLISRDYRESVAIPNIFESSQNSGLNAEGAEESKADQLALSLSDIG